MTVRTRTFTFTRPDGVSQEDFERMTAAMEGIAKAMSHMIKADLSGSCGVRLSRSRKTKRFGPVRHIVEFDE